MHRIVQPGGITGQMRVRYTARRKLVLLAAAKRIQEEEGLSLRQAAKRLMASQSLFSIWQKQCTSRDDPIWALLMSRKKANLTGPLGQLKPLEDMLLCFIFEQREQGINVNTLSLVISSMVIFKGKADGLIARKEFRDYPTIHHYRCQDNA